MSTYGDAEPEDAYDASDRIEERLRVLGLIVEAREADTDTAHRDRRGLEIVRLLDAILADLGVWFEDAEALFDRVNE